MGIRLLVQREGERTLVRAKGPVLVIPVQASIAEVRAGALSQVVDRAAWLLVPAGIATTVLAVSPFTHTLILSPSETLRRDLVATYSGEVDPALLASYLRRVELLPRTTWVNEICHRYLFERAVCRKKDNVATAFLETEILKEVYFVCHERHTTRERASLVAGESALVAKAMTVIDAHLFEEDVVERIARACAASASTVLRAFKKELGTGPAAYVRSRRLDESFVLLKARKYSVGEVATMVGYKNFAAFSEAFRVRFGTRPSEVKR
jgi:AraC-like DNA-binding protein